ncbi:Methylamine utilisation protein MauE [Syntrophus gentianae]|uniref:Methylamine utilisation protein MauE n=1 Tax=Syntrophus gentianae TaxID=43775 RepID=A0A1H8A6R6_9BACT|nr:MauE/DoxX family redox-associated membrane protein [Syntrophus gentianae]SEM65237.1 Methylamine utilisation protein MauE [Syntrophus gentianae]
MWNSIVKLLSSLWIYRGIRLALAVLFVYGGVVKLLDPHAFARTLSAYDLVPDALLPVVAIGLPIVELLAGLALVFDLRGSLATIAGLFFLFLAVLGYGILQNLDVDCGCFGAEELDKQAGLRLAFYRDLAIAGIVIPYLYLSRWMRLKKEKAPEIGPTDKNKL